MKKITTIIAMLLIVMLIAAAPLMGCVKTSPASGTTTAKEAETTKAAETTAVPETTAAPETEAAVSTKTYTVENESDGVTITFEVPEVDGIEAVEIESSHRLRIFCDEEGWSLTLQPTTSNAEALAKSIDTKEKVTFGDNTGYVEFGSWAAQGKIDFGKIEDSPLALTADFDLRPADTYQPDDEDELRGYLENENVILIMSSIQAEKTGE